MCNFNTFKNIAGQIMWPTYSLGTGSMANYGGFLQFQQNMWNHYQGISPGPSGCAWFTNRVDLWTDQLIGPPPLPPITNTYQLALKNAKIQFAQEMWLQCACPGPVPV